MFERMANGWALAKESSAVLKQEKSLVLFPLLSGIACLLVLASFIVPVFMMGQNAGGFDKLADEWGESPLIYVGVFLFYFVNYFVIVFFNSALVACAVVRFRGGDPTLGTGISAAMKRIPQITGWALVSATVGMLLKALENQERIGAIVSAILGTVWTIGTYFVVPVLVVEGLGPVEAVKRSMSVMKNTWGEAMTANFGIGLFTFLSSLPGIGLIFFGARLVAADTQPLGGILIVCGLIALLAVSLISSAVKSILLAGLYLYAADGEVPQQFNRTTFQNAFGGK